MPSLRGFCRYIWFSYTFSSCMLLIYCSPPTSFISLRTNPLLPNTALIKPQPPQTTPIADILFEMTQNSNAMELEDGNGNINAHILARTTAEQERKTRWVRCGIALVGVSFPNSAWYVYVIQVLGLLCQIGVLIVRINLEDYYATNDEIDDELDAQAQTSLFLALFIQVFPWCFLCYLTRSDERHFLNDVIKNLMMPWWMYVVPFVANLAICVEAAAIFSAFWFFFYFISCLPSSIAILLVFAYVVEFGKQLPVIESIDDIKDKILRYETEIQDKINKINWGLILPNVIFWVFITLDQFWFMMDDIKIQKYDWAVIHGFFFFFLFLYALTFLIPPVYFTYVMNTFVSYLDKQYCEQDTGVLGWLRNKKLGWNLIFIYISPQLFGRVGAVLGAAVLTGLARLL